MSRKTSIHLPDAIDDFLSTRANSLSGAIAQTVDRYSQILRRSQIELSDAEFSLVCDSLNGVFHQPAELIRGIWQGVEDSIRLDGLADKWGVDGAALVEKLKGLTYAQEVALVERVEQWWRQQG